MVYKIQPIKPKEPIRDDLVNEVTLINNQYKSIFGENLPEIMSTENGMVESATKEELAKIKSKYFDISSKIHTIFDNNARNNQQPINVIMSNPERYGINKDDLKKLWVNTIVSEKEKVIPTTNSITSTTPETSTEDKWGMINAAYAPQYDEMIRTLTSNASRRGGLDTGGFATSLAKGSAEIGAAKAGAMIDWDKFLKSLELPTQQFEWQKNVQFPEQVSEFNKNLNFQKTQYSDQMKALQDYYASQQKSNWYDPLLTILGTAAGGFAGGVGAGAATKLLGFK